MSGGEYDFSGLPLTMREAAEDFQRRLALVEQQPTNETIADLGRDLLPFTARLVEALRLGADELAPLAPETAERAAYLAELLEKHMEKVADMAEEIDPNGGDEDADLSVWR